MEIDLKEDIQRAYIINTKKGTNDKLVVEFTFKFKVEKLLKSVKSRSKNKNPLTSKQLNLADSIV